MAHDYFGIDYCENFKIINCDLIEALEFIKADLKKDGRQATLDYLVAIEKKLKI